MQIVAGCIGQSDSQIADSGAEKVIIQDCLSGDISGLFPNEIILMLVQK